MRTTITVGPTARSRVRTLAAGALVWTLSLALPAASPAQGANGNGGVSGDTTRRAEAAEVADGGPSAWRTIGWITVGEFGYAAAADAINLNRHQLGREWSAKRALGYIVDPFGAPRSDFECLTRNGCLPVETSHYLSWAALGAGARLAGHGPVESFLLTGVFSNWLWEYAVEGTNHRPSGHDLVINAVGSAAGIGLYELAKSIF